MKRRSTRRKNRKEIIIIIVVALAVLAGAAILIMVAQSRGKGPVQPLLSIEECGSPELLIKGCLFELGIARKDVRFSENTVNVVLHRPLSSQKLSRAFSPIRDVGELHVKNAGHVRMIINREEWNVYFSGASARAARCAIIVDDIGLNLKSAKAFCDIDADLTFSVLPDRPFSVKAARFLHDQGKEILLHLPMEGNGRDPGKGAIYQHMSRAEIRSVLRRDLQSVPHIKGVNNHMGSRVTADPDIMRLVFQGIGEKGLFFVDSLTTGKSVCRAAAHEVGIPFIARDVFLDNERADSYITSQIDKLVKISLHHSDAVAICHPYPETIAVLAREIPKFRERGVEIVRVSALIGSRGRSAP
jgi:polysaccharide deacetylase 2 family uncharacterized protein YibQ